MCHSLQIHFEIATFPFLQGVLCPRTPASASTCFSMFFTASEEMGTDVILSLCQQEFSCKRLDFFIKSGK